MVYLDPLHSSCLILLHQAFFYSLCSSWLKSGPKHFFLWQSTHLTVQNMKVFFLMCFSYSSWVLIWMIFAALLHFQSHFSNALVKTHEVCWVFCIIRFCKETAEPRGFCLFFFLQKLLKTSSLQFCNFLLRFSFSLGKIPSLLLLSYVCNVRWQVAARVENQAKLLIREKIEW